jgi:hypothetical protein
VARNLLLFGFVKTIIENPMTLTRIALALGLCTLIAPAVHATAVNPVFDSFGPQPTFTFGGSGIPNDAVAVSSFSEQINSANVTWTFGLTATPRFSGPALANDGAGTFTAATGTTLSPANLLGSTWNIGFYVALTSDASLPSGGSFKTRLYYDLDPGVGTSLVNHGRLESNNPIAGLSNVAQGSQNMLFSFWTLPFSNPASTNVPQGGTFNALVPGEYTFQLALVNDNGVDVDDSVVAIRVNVIDPNGTVPLPGTLALLLAGLVGGMAAKRRLA